MLNYRWWKFSWWILVAECSKGQKWGFGNFFTIFQ